MVPDERRWRGMGGGMASSLPEEWELELGEVGDRGGWSEWRWQ